MKITNRQAVTFFNTVSEIKEKYLPIKLLYALDYNVNLFADQLTSYEKARKVLEEQYGDIIHNTPKELIELLDESVEQAAKTVNVSLLEAIDANPNYDKLSLSNYNAIRFMVEDDEMTKE